jgi:hypothetical protein
MACGRLDEGVYMLLEIVLDIVVEWQVSAVSAVG